MSCILGGRELLALPFFSAIIVWISVSLYTPSIVSFDDSNFGPDMPSLTS
jgi:hypothetical protein